MKTTLGILLFVVFACSPILAQDKTPTNFRDTGLQDVVRWYSKQLGKDIEYDQLPTSTFSGTAVTSVDGLRRILANYDLTAQDMGSFIRISKMQGTVSAATPPVVGPANEGQASLDTFLACVHSGPDAGQTSRYLFCNQSSQAAFVPRPIYTAQTAYPTVTNSPYGYGGYGDANPYAYYWFGPCRSFMPRDERPVRCVQTSITFKIKEDYLADATLHIDGHDFGRVGQFATRHIFPDRKLYLGADKEHVIEIVRSGDSESMVKNIEAESVRLMGGRPIEILVSENQFAHTPYGRKIVPNHGEKVDGKELVMGTKK